MLKRLLLGRLASFFPLFAALGITLATAAPVASQYTLYLPLAHSADVPLVTATLRWSDPTTWPSGRVPVAGEAVTIAAGTNVLLDISPPALASLTIAGALVFDQQDLALTAGWIMLHDGTLTIGSEEQPFTKQATITLNAGVDDNFCRQLHPARHSVHGVNRRSRHSGGESQRLFAASSNGAGGG